MAKNSTPLVLATTALLALAACDGKIIGEGVDEGGFGNPTMTNLLVQTGQINPVQALGERFAREVPTTITFPFNSAQLTPEARATLDRQANFIRQFPEVRFRVYGHADLVGSDGYNYSLGKRRAEAVVGYFAARGLSRSRLEALVSYGETRPVIQTPGPEEANRRTVTEVSGFVARHPTVLDGKYADIIYRTYIEGAVSVPTTTTGAAGAGDPGASAPPAGG
ncbi:OmpA family protein [Paragemmobacter ruber]|uniref:OmpA family protein n=1 Tax=Paragemmobacter ruber TaxID=1985673 RepID=A0ABW9Y7G9_9RHOB|nr:OmpA family protein [Rhodobacter ruber]NBE08036.1 OmpA family protein [Rhodobacter ruber]